MSEVRVYGRFVAKPAARVAECCRRFDVNPREPVLLVMATVHGAYAFAEAVAAAGERPLTVGKHGELSGVVEVRADYLAQFAAQYPDRLLATAATGRPQPRNADGTRTTVWADLSEATASTPIAAAG